VPALLPAVLSPRLPALLAPRRTARHARPSKAAPVLAATGLTAALALADVAVTAPAASAGGSIAQFERLASCESGGRWNINTGNGYYGGLQFNLATWRGLGMSGYPHQASKATQIAAGQKLHSQRGWQPWPACSRKLGLSGDGDYSGSGQVPAPPARPAKASRSRPAAAPVPVVGRTVRGTSARVRAVRIARMRTLRPVAPPAFAGDLSTRDVRRYRPAVAQWQARMAARGWAIKVDGRFGPRSAGVAAAFARNKGIRTRTPGVVTRAVWDAAWTTRVT
jgi:resuscitation-promoting factor RpfA